MRYRLPLHYFDINCHLRMPRMVSKTFTYSFFLGSYLWHGGISKCFIISVNITDLFVGTLRDHGIT